MNHYSRIFLASTFIVLPLVLTSTALADTFMGNAPKGSKALNQAAVTKTSTSSAQAKLKSCQAKENAIKNRSTQLTKRAQDMETTFDNIASRVEDYYTSKVVTSGKTVSKYNSLVSDIQSKKSAVSQALSSASTDADSFSCTSTDPKGELTQYRKDMQSAIKALKAYRTSIKNLIVAVHSVVGETNSTKPASGSAAEKTGGETSK